MLANLSYREVYIFSAILSFALLALGFRSISSMLAVTGFFVMIFNVGDFLHIHTGSSFEQTQPFASSENTVLTNLSSKE